MAGAIVDRGAAVRIPLPAFRDPGLALFALYNQPGYHIRYRIFRENTTG